MIPFNIIPDVTYIIIIHLSVLEEYMLLVHAPKKIMKWVILPDKGEQTTNVTI